MKTNRAAELLAKIPGFKKRQYKKQRQIVEAVTRAYLARGWQQKQLAAKMEIDPASLNRMLSGMGANMTIETLARFEEVLQEEILLTRAEVIEALVQNPIALSALWSESLIPKSGYYAESYSTWTNHTSEIVSHNFIEQAA
jgi:transcriptional regulator with XRE-family HTH domain